MINAKEKNQVSKEENQVIMISPKELTGHKAQWKKTDLLKCKTADPGRNYSFKNTREFLELFFLYFFFLLWFWGTWGFSNFFLFFLLIIPFFLFIYSFLLPLPNYINFLLSLNRIFISFFSPLLISHFLTYQVFLLSLSHSPYLLG